MADSKRKLDMLPEVLPPPPGPAGGGPRQRALKTLARLVAAAGTTVMTGCSTGYGVVDPIPPPSRCDGLADSIDVTITLSNPETIVIKLGRPRLLGAAFTGTVLVQSGGILVSSNIQSDSASVEISVGPATASPVVVFGVSCSGQVGRLLAFVTVASPGDGGARDLSVNLVDDR